MRQVSLQQQSGNRVLLYAAIKAGNFDGFVKILASLDDINVVIRNGLSALHLVAAAGQYRMARHLINQRARIDLRATENLGRTPLWFALQNQQHLLAKLLLVSGANVADETQVLQQFRAQHPTLPCPSNEALNSAKESSGSLIPLALLHSLVLSEDVLFRQIILHINTLSEEKRRQLRSVLMPIARLAAQKKRFIDLAVLGHFIGNEHVQESMDFRPVLYWLLVSRSDDLPAALIEQFKTSESQAIALHYFEQDGHADLLREHYAAFSQHAEAVRMRGAEPNTPLERYAAKADLDSVKVVSLNENKSFLFSSMVFAYQAGDFVAFNTFFSATELTLEKAFERTLGSKDDGLKSLRPYFTLLQTNSADVAQQYLKRHSVQELESLFSLPGLLEIAFLQSSPLLLNQLKLKSTDENFNSLLKAAVHEHVRTHYDAALPHGDSVIYTIPQKRVLIEHYERCGIPVLSDGLVQGGGRSILENLGEIDTGPIAEVYDFLDLKDKGVFRTLNKAYCAVEGVISFGVQQEIQEKGAQLAALAQVIYKVRLRRQIYLVLKVAGLASFGAGVYCFIYALTHTRSVPCRDDDSRWDFLDDDERQSLQGDDEDDSCEQFVGDGGLVLGLALILLIFSPCLEAVYRRFMDGRRGEEASEERIALLCNDPDEAWLGDFPLIPELQHRKAECLKEIVQLRQRAIAHQLREARQAALSAQALEDTSSHAFSDGSGRGSSFIRLFDRSLTSRSSEAAEVVEDQVRQDGYSSLASGPELV